MHHCNTNQTIVASIRRHSSRSPVIQKTLKEFRRNIDDLSELPAIIDEVSKLMGLRGFTDSYGDNAFASDALQIDTSGPIGLHLSIVDLPGLISVSNEEKTDEDVDKASNDIANQGIIKLARQFDPDDGRTVGIITKPDLINEGTESKIARVAKNLDNIKLKLGFFLVKNPKPSELEEGLDMDTRSRRELQFFSSPPWLSQGLYFDRVGAEKLRVFLQDLLDAHIERELPKVKTDIKNGLLASETELQVLGEPHPTVGHIRTFLIGLSLQFTGLEQVALDGNYHGNYQTFFDHFEGSRLRARIQQLNTAFATEVLEKGEKRRIKAAFDPFESDNESTNDVDEQITVTKAEMIGWVKQAYVRTKGRELLGNYSSDLLGELFQEEAKPWSPIAERHVSNVFGAVSRWIDNAIDVIFHDEKIRREVRDLLQDWMERTRKQALEELEKLVLDEKRSPLTYNHYYTNNHGKLHIPNNPVEIEKFVSALQARIIVDMDDQACNEALTELNAYYKDAIKTFVDNVARQVIERHIAPSLPSAFCPDNVSQMSDEVLLNIGSEPENQIQRRQKPTEIAQRLRQSLAALQN
ncbi:unnamed protein product [Fusarium graminearum]|nr:unnamed protein product [Fusarium graminearum]